MKRIIFNIVILILTAFLFFLSAAYAGNKQQQLDSVNSRINQTQSQLSAGKKKERQLNQQIKELEIQINTTENEIGSIKTNIDKTEKEIAVAELSLVKLEQQIAGQNDNLQKRLRTMYKYRDTDLIQVLLSSEDITEFMANMDMVQKIFDNDVQMLKNMESQYNQTDEQKKVLQTLQEQLVSKKQQQSDKQASLVVSRGDVADLKAQVANDNEALENQLDEYNKEADQLSSEIRKLQGNQVYLGGNFCWPSASSMRATSEFGYRVHPILKVKKMHTGLDIGAAAGTNVLAGNNGTVIKAAWNDSYGNMIMIDHGGGIVSLYAHNSKLLVNKGDVVNKGQVIALVGATGRVTGPHIHFEIRVNGEYKNPRSWF